MVGARNESKLSVFLMVGDSGDSEHLEQLAVFTDSCFAALRVALAGREERRGLWFR